jgi:hypothetical protein
MIGMWRVIPLFAVWLIILMAFTGNSMLDSLKINYWKTLDVLRSTGDSLWDPVLRPAIITGMSGKRDGVIGSNVNKGYEIYICLDGDDVNSATYVLLHELAHMTVKEYDHSTAFWNNFKKIKEIAIQNGIYTKKGTKNYCGDVIPDS